MLSPLELLTEVQSAKSGTFIEYYNGSLVMRRDRKKRAIAGSAWSLYKEGLVLLVSKRMGDEHYCYYAVRSSKDYSVGTFTRTYLNTLETWFKGG